MFKRRVKNYQTRYLSKTWQKMLQNREILKNSYHATGDVEKAKAFANSVATYTPHIHDINNGEHVIFSHNTAVASEPGYAFTSF